MKIKTEASQHIVSAMGADTPNYVLETSLNEATPSPHDEALYAQLEAVEGDDDEMLWYPMNIRHSNPKKARMVRDKLSEKGLTTYLRLNYREDIVGDELRNVATPALSNLIFVRTQKKVARYLKGNVKELLSLQFMTKPKKDRSDKADILTVPERAMHNFIQAEILPDPRNQRIQLDYKSYIDKTGRRVKIIRGPFVGIEGEVKHIGGHRLIVVKLPALGLATGIAYVSPQDMILLDDPRTQDSDTYRPAT